MNNSKKYKRLASKVLIGFAIGTALFAGETKIYPQEMATPTTIGYRLLENSYGVMGDYEGNTVFVNKGAKFERVFGASTTLEKESVDFVRNNTVIIDGGVLETNGRWTEKENEVRGGSVYGGAAQSSVVTNNTVIIKGDSRVEGNVYAGYSHRGSVINNKIVIEGNPTFGEETVLFGGRGSRSINVKEDKVTLAPLDVITGNTLEIKTKNVKVNDVKNFENFVFVVNEEDLNKNEILLNLTNPNGVVLEKPEKVKVSAKLTDVTDEFKENILKVKNKEINLNFDVVVNGVNKKVKDAKITLIHANAGLKLDNLPKEIMKSENGHKYEVRFEKDDNNLYAIVNVK